MKKIFALGLSVMFSGAALAQTDRDELPQESSDFINEHFATERIAEVDVDDSWYNLSDSETYEVRFENGIELDFNDDGEITEIESDNNEPIPMSVLPQEVRSKVERKHPNARVVNWEKDDDGHEVELDNGEELEFDRHGEVTKDKNKDKDWNRDRNTNNNNNNRY